MKKVFILFTLGLFVSLFVNSQTCLPEGITFTHQTQIDSFPYNYPDCIEIEGYLALNGVSINSLDSLHNLTKIQGGFYPGYTYLTDFSGLEKLQFIGGDFSIGYNDVLENFSGLDSLKTIGGYLWIQDNNKLKNLTGLESLTEINGYIWIGGNPEISSLEGIDNVSEQSITNFVRIHNNPALTICHVESICAYLSSPNGEIEINSNNSGCNSQEEVEEACTVSTIENQLTDNHKIYPNPFTTNTTIEFTVDQPSEITVTIFNHQGKQVDLIRQYQQSGKQQLTWNAEGLSPGMYFFTLQAGEQVATGKMVLMN